MTGIPSGHLHLKLKLQQLIGNLTKEYSVEKVTTNIIVFKKNMSRNTNVWRGGGWINELENVPITTCLGRVYKIHRISAAGRIVVQ